MGNQNHCIECEATDDRENGIVVGLYGELNEPYCNICLSEWFEKNTPLRSREADIHTLQVLMGWNREEIANFLGISKSTVGTLVSRIAERIANSVRFAELT